MGRRPEVATASVPVTAADLAGLAAQMGLSLARVPFRRPLHGGGNPVHNAAVSVTRECLRSFMGYAGSLRIDEYRSMEMVLDDLCRVVMPSVALGLGAVVEEETVAGVPGVWVRPRGAASGTVLYLHGGGYIGTSPWMYVAFVAGLCRATGCQVFVADYRLAPEFAFPADVQDAVLVLEALRHRFGRSGPLFLAGDSGGGGLACTLLYTAQQARATVPAGAILFSPEVDLRLTDPSLTDNAGADILPWNIPTAAYLHGRDPGAPYLSPVTDDVSRWPPVLVAYGDDEMFRDPIRVFVDHLQQAGVDTTVFEEPGMFHVFPILMPWAAASRRVYAGVGRFVRRVGAAPTPAPNGSHPHRTRRAHRRGAPPSR